MSCLCKCHVALPNGAGVGLQFVIVVFLDHTYFLGVVFAHLFQQSIDTDGLPNVKFP